MGETVLSIVTVPAVPPKKAEAGVTLSHATSIVPSNQFITAPSAVQVPLPPLPPEPHWSCAVAEAGTAKPVKTTERKSDRRSQFRCTTSSLERQGTAPQVGFFTFDCQTQ